MDESCSINEFCRIERISRSFFYKLESHGQAPKTYNVGRIRRITRASHEAWRAAREAASQVAA
jgi:predicted DNA-binding transcriptional regulator AlpA